MSNIEEARGYFVHLRLEHRKLENILQRIKFLANWNASGLRRNENSPDLTQQLQLLRANLAGHFAEEEAGGCLEEAVCHCPRLGREADRIEGEHSILLSELDDIIRRSHSIDRELQRMPAEVQQMFDQFAADLYAHEAAESRLLETAFGLEAG